jgi:ATP-dependent Clp protease ATP-binding subunit ClpA
VDEARRLNHHYIGTEHLLLGLVREGEGIAAGVLESLGISLAMVRAEVVRVLSASRLQARERGAAQDEPVAPTEAPASASALQRAVEAVRAAKDAAVAEQDYLRASELRDIETRLEQMLDS